ncbi:helix-turn-helix domain-containing protein [Phocaeicola faecalis]|uniref:HTH domain-containing protein n=1 Tax=Phocaeicola faecalis TaxID=2786956 RepID=UPI001F1894E2|nr:HTH domain-containing protein [Phocaeicola faecalis]
MKYVDIRKIIRMDFLIQHRSTGSPAEFAQKLEVSRSTFFEYLAYMREELMLDIQYNKYKETYYYDGKDLCSVLGISHQISIAQ